MSTQVLPTSPLAGQPAAAPRGTGTAGAGLAAGGFFQRSELGRTLYSFRRELFWVAVFSLFANVLLLTPTLYLMQVYDRVTTSGSETTLAALTLIAVFLFLVMGFAEWVRSRLLVRAGARFDTALHTRVFNANFEASLGGGGARAQQGFSDLTQLRQFLTGNGIFALVDLPWTAIYIVVLFLMHPWLGWLATGFAVLLLLVAIIGNRYTAQAHKQAQETQTESTAYLYGKLRNAETVQALGMLGDLRRHWQAIHERVMSRTATASERSHRVQSVTKFVQYTQQSLMLSVGALLAIDGQISAGSMIACNALMGNALRPISLIVQTWRQFVDTRQAYGRLEGLLAQNPEREATHVGDTVAGQISLRQLVATAPGRQRPILNGLDADCRAGEVVAIVGPSGAGKSTLARCIVGIWPETSGQVLLDGQPIEQWSREALGPHIGYLPQDIELFDGTIAENIARFAPVPSETVIDAAQRTGIHEMVLRLPKGYDTQMGEAGQMLSGGQRQRIGLARAILGDPALVVLDEPNANLDDIGEAALVRTVRELKSRGKTVFMIVHQQHMLAVADRVLFLENGQITRFLPLVAKNDAQPGPANP
ncbi:type I secretion system permease/ATPase [Aquabacterium sp.]|uniref:type I secretion system permease/ATPase n=1 Tax=Aquabacterium sp. TaxID=1872578 RepID=UPI002BC47EB5|nr:type I secretion system permease/ATPase [Aquabacterium sp.]HSW05888.1 type I secretion system permease/ATPase [Aquabacterium sp.]